MRKHSGSKKAQKIMEHRRTTRHNGSSTVVSFFAYASNELAGGGPDLHLSIRDQRF
jgi:hypothetical protein